MADNCKIVQGRCGARQICWAKSGKIKRNRAVIKAMGIFAPVTPQPKKFHAKKDCLVNGKLKKGFRFIDGRCKFVGTPGMRGVRRRRRGVGCPCNES